jgi:hypothetical protein
MRRTRWLGKGEREIQIGDGDEAVRVVVRELTARDVRELRAMLRDELASAGEAVAIERWGCAVVRAGTVRVEPGYERGDGTPITTGADLAEHGDADVIDEVFKAVWPEAEAAAGNG